MWPSPMKAVQEEQKTAFDRLYVTILVNKSKKNYIKKLKFNYSSFLKRDDKNLLQMLKNKSVCKIALEFLFELQFSLNLLILDFKSKWSLKKLAEAI